MAVKNKSRRKKRMGGNTDMMKMVGDMGQKIIDKHGDKIAEHGQKLMHQAVAAAVPIAIAGVSSYASKKLGSITSKPVDYNDYDDELSEDEYEQDGGKKNRKYKKSKMTKKRRKSKRKSKKH
jgi:hypothetical protein